MSSLTYDIGEKICIDRAYCKGCGICVEFCGKNALIMKYGKAHILDESRCVKCGLCELRCPDYAIYMRGDKVE